MGTSMTLSRSMDSGSQNRHPGMSRKRSGYDI
ncbi:hypothetical protein OKW45_004291 [Paraburkholderia sp. WSM4175]